MNTYAFNLSGLPVDLHDARMTDVMLEGDALTFVIPGGILTAQEPERTGPARLVLRGVDTGDILCRREVASATRKTKRCSAPDFAEVAEKLHAGEIFLEVLLLHTECGWVLLWAAEFSPAQGQYTARIELEMAVDSMACCWE